MLQALRPADAALRRPTPLTIRSIAVTTFLALAVVAVAAMAASTGV